MKKSAALAIFVTAGLMLISVSCASAEPAVPQTEKAADAATPPVEPLKNRAEETPKPAGAKTPAELVRNFTDAFNRNDSSAVVECFSKNAFKNEVAKLRADAQEGGVDLDELGLTREDMNLSDEKLFEKIFAKIREKKIEETEALGKLRILNVMIDGNSGVVKVEDKNGDTRVIDVVFEGGFWIISQISPPESGKSAESEHVYSAKVSVVKSDLASIRDALELYKLNMASYPEKLEYLFTAPPDDGTGTWSGPYLQGGAPKDSWGTEYQYNPVSDSGTGYDLYSFGADGKKGGDGQNKDLTIQELLYGQNQDSGE